MLKPLLPLAAGLMVTVVAIAQTREPAPAVLAPGEIVAAGPRTDWARSAPSG